MDNLGDKGKGKENEKIANLTVKGFFLKGNFTVFDFDGETGQKFLITTIIKLLI